MNVAERITLRTLSQIQQCLDEMLVTGNIDQERYDKEWNETLQAVGWTAERYAEELDRAWDDGLPPSVPPPKTLN